VAGEEARAANIIGRVFGPDAWEVDRAWCGDISYVRTWEGWAYLATVIDLASRRVVGWALADHMETDLVVDALRMAIAARRPEPGLIFHSDRGCQGGIRESSQHLDRGGVRRWESAGNSELRGRSGRRCARRGGRQAGSATSGSVSGSRS
jgi:transposase InsO family protein